jgi:hypothetical protein
MTAVAKEVIPIKRNIQVGKSVFFDISNNIK